ncbi:N-acetyl-gamma-glutamyl-phosphate reductase [Actinobaculum sp. 352]|uniref:N-acetyl-gamma-glutamyl-phosphate reductase n=1 Tax=Actinobaculum sp. 352 TaxID=2490946 RepID=UPI000F7F87D8|nr:N-acetyl-gamma-glutamyl-phosphate reductase [Actinobaculum sp. 352]RTE48690.1 N-acetyl-gamma-glutamyl-phosphate reductase [Actinobaculum sp. 352]
MTWKVSVAGATGYAGGEVLRLIEAHPDLEVGALCAGTSTGALEQYQPHLRSLAEQEVQPTEAEVLADADIAILGLPHGTSGRITAQIQSLNPQCYIVDLGADHRLESAADWESFYGSEAAAPWAYGMPELARAQGPSQREILRRSRYIASPGCNASAVTLAAQPAVKAGLADGADIVAILSVGYSGAGKGLKPHLLAAEALGSGAPYAVGGSHRHIPEIAQNLRAAGGTTTTLAFTPVLVPMSRGILATVSIPVRPGATADDVVDAYTSAYRPETFVRISQAWPTTAMVQGSNTALVKAVLDRDGRRLTAICAIDNLVKGTAGAAIQSLNVALGLPEGRGLTVNGVAP